MLTSSDGSQNELVDEGTALVPTRRRSLGDEVADRLRAAILGGELAPGEHLREEELALRLSVSRGPIRSALALLEREGLTRPAGHRGVVVAELSERDFFEIRTLRSALEVLAVHLIVSNSDSSALDGLRVLAEQAGEADARAPRQAVERDLQFHDALVAAAGHARLHLAWSELRLATQMLLLSEAAGCPDWQETMSCQHASILRAVGARDPMTAAALIVGHIEEPTNPTPPPTSPV
jgi:DNA-binding GntR family transcriptional regulator